MYLSHDTITWETFVLVAFILMWGPRRKCYFSHLTSCYHGIIVCTTKTGYGLNTATTFTYRPRSGVIASGNICTCRQTACIAGRSSHPTRRYQCLYRRRRAMPHWLRSTMPPDRRLRSDHNNGRLSKVRLARGLLSDPILDKVFKIFRPIMERGCCYCDPLDDA